MSACLQEHVQWHPCWVHQRQVSEPFNVVKDRFTLLLYGREEFVHGYLGIILV